MTKAGVGGIIFLSKRDGLRANEIFLREESPGSIEQGCRLTAGGGDSKDSATENKRFPLGK